MISGKTQTGFKFEISETALENMELLDILAEVDEDPLKLPTLLKLLLGSDQKKALYEHVRLEDGTVPVEAVSAEVLDIFKTKTVKN